MVLTTHNLAKLFGVTSVTIHNLIKNKKLNYKEKSPKGKFFFDAKNVREYLDLFPFKKPHILTVGNAKGGVGKSTISLILSQALTKMGFNVLFIDLDPQANATEFLLGELPEKEDLSISNIFNDNCIKRPIYETEFGIDIIPSNLDFSIISKRDDLQTVTSLSKYKNNFNEYEYVIIDSPPNIQSPVEAAIIASDYFLFVAKARKWAFNGVNLINKTIKEINSAYQADKCKVIGCVINQFKRTQNLDKNLLEKSELLLKGVKPLDTIIPNYLQYSEAIDNRAAFFSSFIKPKYQKVLKTFVLEVTNEIKR